MNVIGGYFGSAPHALKAAGDAKSIQFFGENLLNSACIPINTEYDSRQGFRKWALTPIGLGFQNFVRMRNGNLIRYPLSN